MLRLGLGLADALLLVIAAIGMIRLRSVLRYTTLMTAWPWAWVAWTAGVISTMLHWRDPAAASYGDYFAAVAVLSPPMASLGARRPTCRSWPYFVMLPMFAVLLWPAVSVGLATGFARPLELETPAIAMYFVVLVMSWGNYALGRLGAVVVLFCWLLAGIVCRETAWIPHFAIGPQRTLTLLIAIWLIFGFRSCARTSLAPLPDDEWIPKPSLDRFDHVLLEFGELYGLVWSLRLQDRLNVFAQQSKWPGQFVAFRGVWTTPLTEQQLHEIEHAFRWLLRRFVDPEWLNCRLAPSGTRVAKEDFASPIDS